jgi:hypothetical protein
MRYKTLAAALFLATLAPTIAEAKRARCFTTDDGYFACNFVSLDGVGSFRISARGKPSYSMLVNSPGFASGYVNFGNRGIPISGMFVRQRSDRACWNNPEMEVKVCVW